MIRLSKKEEMMTLALVVDYEPVDVLFERVEAQYKLMDGRVKFAPIDLFPLFEKGICEWKPSTEGGLMVRQGPNWKLVYPSISHLDEEPLLFLELGSISSPVVLSSTMASNIVRFPNAMR